MGWGYKPESRGEANTQKKHWNIVAPVVAKTTEDSVTLEVKRGWFFKKKVMNGMSAVWGADIWFSCRKIIHSLEKNSLGWVNHTDMMGKYQEKKSGARYGGLCLKSPIFGDWERMFWLDIKCFQNTHDLKVWSLVQWVFEVGLLRHDGVLRFLTKSVDYSTDEFSHGLVERQKK